MLILEPLTGGLRRFRLSSNRLSAPAAESISSAADPFSSVENDGIFGYVLPNGDGLFPRMIEEATPAALERLADASRLAPPENAAVARLAREGWERFPAGRHFILCETAIFSAMPERAGVYALPRPWREQHPRFGLHGLTHAWIWNTLGRPSRLVSIILGDHPTVAALLDGQGVESSASPGALESLPSLTACGGIDPAIVLELLCQGRASQEIRDLLTRRSGFQVFSDKPASLAEIAAANLLARQILLTGITKESGAALASLGGSEVISITAEKPGEWREVTAALAGQLAFSGADIQILEALRGRVLADTLQAAL